jgi:hypothetical protein
VKLPGRARAFFLSWSLTNVILLDLWRELLRVNDPDYSYWVTSLSPAHYFALMALGVAGGMVGAIAATRVRQAKRGPRVAWWLVLLAGVLYFMNSVRRFVVGVAFVPGPLVERGSLLMLALVLAAVAALVWQRRVSSLRLAAIAGSVLLPFLIYCHVQAFRILSSDVLRREFAAAPTVPVRAPNPVALPSRVVIVVLDEADYGMMFGHRPADLELPHIDSLRRESLTAVDAYAPATYTHASVLSYLAGRAILQPEPISAREAEFLSAGDSIRYRFSDQRTFLMDAADRGARVGVVGWSLPYCRYTNLAASRCAFVGDRTFPRSFPAAAAWMLAEVATVGPLLDRAYGVGLPYHTTDLLTLKREAELMASSPDLDLLWLHLGVPHLPRMYDRKSKKLVGPENVRRQDYADNLALADLTIRDLRRAIEASGAGDRTSLIVTSDHAFRFKAWAGYTPGDRIPLLVHLPYRPRREEHAGRINAINIGTLAVRMLSADSISSTEIRQILGAQ